MARTTKPRRKTKKLPACPKPKRGRKRPKGCKAPARRKPVVTPTARPVAITPPPAVSPAAPLPALATPVDAGPVPDVPVAGLTPAQVDLPVLPGPFGPAQAERLLWRAGFGPGPGDVERLVALGLDGAVASLVRPAGEARLVGPEPSDGDGGPLRPLERWGHDHCAWLDRMVRTTHPLAERMTLIWHDWFAVSQEKVGQRSLMQDHLALLRRHALGSFHELARAVTKDPAMLVWLDGLENRRGRPNENHARELMELFLLGAGRGAYTEGDVRELSRAMTGWTADWTEATGLTNFRLAATRHDAGTKTVFGRTGAWAHDDAVRLCLEHPGHPAFFVTKLWGTFVGEPPDATTQAALEALYVGAGGQVVPVLEAILKHPALYAGPSLPKPPVVLAAGLLRRFGRGVSSTDWSWLCLQAGQLLLQPPSVAGWDDAAWLDTSAWRARWDITVWAVLADEAIDPWGAVPYDPAETPEAALERALTWAGRPAMTDEQRTALLAWSRSAVPEVLADWERGPRRAQRQNALRALVLTAPDFQVS